MKYSVQERWYTKGWPGNWHEAGETLDLTLATRYARESVAEQKARGAAPDMVFEVEVVAHNGEKSETVARYSTESEEVSDGD